MINSEAFTKRLKKIFEYYNISASSFAEKLEIPRSSISHIVSGRNKPSLDFVLKTIEHFPEVELYWLLNGKGSFPKKKETKSNIAPTLFSSEVEANNKIKENIEEQTEPIAKENAQLLNNSEIERIVIFYKDGSFKSYLN